MAFTVYKITHHLVGGELKLYIGVTRRTLEKRLSAHFNESTRKKTRGLSTYSLGYAIRGHLTLDKKEDILKETFKIAELQTYSSVQDMLDGEAVWIDRLGTMAPQGYNVLRGGSSAGGPSNSKPCEIFLGGSVQSFSSITAAVDAVVKLKGMDDEKEIEKFHGRVKARMNYKSGSEWTFAAALELEPRDDLRVTELSRTAKAKNENLGTARSRDYRSKKAAQLANVQKVSFIPDPANHNATVSIAKAAELLGVPVSTLRWRLDQIRTKIGNMTSAAILAHLAASQDREQQFQITLPSGELLRAGHNAVAQRFKRPGHSVSAIKSRLRKLGSAPNNDDLLIAIGQKDSPRQEREINSMPVSRKKHCDDWTISNGQAARVFMTQAEFARACTALLTKSTTGQQHLGAHPHDIDKVTRRIQGIACRMTKKGITPEQIADYFGIRAPLSIYP
jgi:predicted GIY-YIG superfamily endonuclease